MRALARGVSLALRGRLPARCPPPLLRRLSGAAAASAGRLPVWERALEGHHSRMQALREEGEHIDIVIPDQGFETIGVKNVTCLKDILPEMRSKDKKGILGAVVNGQLTDVHTPLRGNASVRWVRWADPGEAPRKLMWHSSAHVLGAALEQWAGDRDCLLCDGPPTERGFFYEARMDGALRPEDLSEVEALMRRFAAQNHSFERITVSRELAREMFAYNPLKLELLEAVPEAEEVALYKTGPAFVDLCRGPHIPSTGPIGAMSVLNASAALWKHTDITLQRVHAISFPSKKEMSLWKAQQAEAAKRDHRLIGKQQQLLYFDNHSPGSPFLLPHGAHIYHRLQELIRVENRKRGYEEVVTPLLYDKALWKTSGHWDAYKDDMFLAVPGTERHQLDHEDLQHHSQSGQHSQPDVENPHPHPPHKQHPARHSLALKPMNCPGHALLFASSSRSFRQLPMRISDFGVLHRNELSGSLGGLTRVRKFCQDDAHIFCTEAQIEEEVAGCLEYMDKVYKVLGFEFTMKLSTRPDPFIGDLALWEMAEATLSRCLDQFGHPWEVDPGDGAFYGPKIDLEVTDALGRRFQCATVQLDFQLPRRFELSYVSESGVKETPVMIHRAILGSLERMFGILIEHTGGKWPLWLSPRQCLVIPVSPEVHMTHALSLASALRGGGLRVDVDESDDTIPKKIRNAHGMAYNYSAVLGDREVEQGTVSLRSRDGSTRTIKQAELLPLLRDEVDSAFGRCQAYRDVL